MWKRDIIVNVYTNNGGVGLDGNPLKPVTYTHPHILPADVKVSTSSLLVPMGKPLSAAREFEWINAEDGSIYRTTSGIDTKINFEREGMTQTDNWWTKNGFNNGKQDGDWGEAWIYDDGREHTVVKEMDLYVRWQGEEFNMYYEYYDSESTLLASGSTAVDNKYVSKEGYDYSKQHYNAEIEGLIIPIRHGYDFVAWHSSPSESFSSENVIAPRSAYLWNNDITAYAEWKAIDYPVVYVAKEGEIDDGQGHPVTATKSNSTIRFDIGLASPSFTMSYVPFNRNGYRHVGYEYELPVRKERKTEIEATELVGDRNFYNARTVQNPTTKEWSKEIGDPTELHVMWEANEYKLYFDLNDGQWGNTDTYKGTTYVATGSATDAFDDVNYDATKNMYWMDVVYGDKLNSGAVGDLPNPTRAGYTFDGWFMRQDSTDAAKKVTGDTEYNWEEISYDEHDWTTYVGAKDAKVYAKWSKNKYTIEFLAKPTDEQEMETPAGSIASINMEFDIATTTVIEIPKINLVKIHLYGL